MTKILKLSGVYVEVFSDNTISIIDKWDDTWCDFDNEEAHELLTFLQENLNN